MSRNRYEIERPERGLRTWAQVKAELLAEWRHMTRFEKCYEVFIFAFYMGAGYLAWQML